MPAGAPAGATDSPRANAAQPGGSSSSSARPGSSGSGSGTGSYLASMEALDKALGKKRQELAVEQKLRQQADARVAELTAQLGRVQAQVAQLSQQREADRAEIVALKQQLAGGRAAVSSQ